MLLELNARPGLAIQMANGEGLRPRLDLVEGQSDKLPPEERVRFAQEHFARHSELEVPGPDAPIVALMNRGTQDACPAAY